jgi:cytoskeleton protein RodZ
MTKLTPMAANEDDSASRRRIHLREISGDADAPLETVGQDLRAARIRRGDDLAAVSRALKIRKDHLDALESDQLDRLPGKTYAIGFVRSYARYLGLDAAVLAERFKAEISGRGEEQGPPPANLHEDEGRRLPYGWRILAAVIGLALLWGIWHIFFANRDAAPPVPPPPSLTHVGEAAHPVVSPTAMAPPPRDQAAPPAMASPQAAQPADAPVPVRQAAATQASTTQAAVPAVPQAQALPASAQVFGEQNRASSRIALRATGATRITVRGADGRLYINRDLSPGEVYYVPNLPGLNLALSNAGAVEATLDGKVLGPIGQENQVVGRVSLDPQSLVDRFNVR